MRVKLEWLNELVDIVGLEVSEIVNRLSLYAVEVENCEKIINATHIVVGHVLTKNPHPDSDHLNVLTVDVKDSVLQIVCGASNVEAGQYVIVAKEGAILPGDFKIKKSKIRGVESCGMVCSLQELGIEKKFIDEKYQNGIYYFEDKVNIGDDAASALHLDDYVLDLAITPNRGDLLSMIGVSYEISAVFKRELKPLVYQLQRNVEKEDVNITLATEKCYTYYAQVIKDVKIRKSPLWLRSRLMAFGVRPINNVVDITNYILALYGQPLHSFDFDKLGKKIVVREAYENEEITTLDGIKRSLEVTDVVITDGKKPVAIAGVMGGIDTEIDEHSQNILLEAAVFSPLSVRKTSSRLGLRSESSIRFERGVDLNRTKEALDFASYLYTSLASGKVMSNYAFAGVKSLEPKLLQVTEGDFSKLLGIKIPQEEIISLLRSLHFNVTENLEVTIPTRRFDIAIKEDLVEEVIRLYGYDRLKTTYPIDNLVGGLSWKQKALRKLKDIFSTIGLNEIVTYSLVNKEKNNLFMYNKKDDISPVCLLMPLSSDHEFLRFGLISSILEVMKYNFSRKISDLALFEIGKVYYTQGENKEDLYLGGAMANVFSSTLWEGKEEKVDFYLVKGVIDYAFAKLGYTFKYLPMEPNNDLHPHRSANIYFGEEKVGFLGQVHPKYALENDLKETYVFEINLDLVLVQEPRAINYQDFSKLPSIQRDLAFVVKKDVLASDMVEAIYKTDRKLITEVSVFDVYEGENVGNDEKSIAFKLVFTSHDVLTEEVINNKITKVIKDLKYRFNATLRS